MSIHVLVSVTVEAPNVTDFQDIVTELQTKSREEAGCIFYTFCCIALGSYRVVECWRTQDALDAHEATEHFTRLVPRMIAVGSIAYLRRTMPSTDISMPVGLPSKTDIYMVVYVHVSDKDTFAAYSGELALLSRAEDGCLYYTCAELPEPTEDGSNFAFVEIWKSEVALETHRESDHCKRLIPLLDSVSSVKVVDQGSEAFV